MPTRMYTEKDGLEADAPQGASELKGVVGWQQIDTAPNELNKHFMLYGDGPSITDCTFVGYQTDVWGPLEWREITGRYVMQPTHWMPLPEPPTA